MKGREQPEALSPLPETSGREFASRTSSSRRSSLINSSAESPRLSSRPSNKAPRSVDLHIEELILNGFAPADRYAIGEAVERELTRLFAEQGTAAIARNVEITSLNAGEIKIEAGSNAEATGIRLARAIYGGLG